MRITLLVDNNGAPGLAVEHGFSALVEAGGRRVLFDTGAGRALSPNARALDVDLSTVDTLVLSHGHFDHTGAIPEVVAAAPALEVFAHPGVFRFRASVRDGVPRPIHMQDEARAALESLPAARFHPVAEPLALSDGIGLTGPVPRETDFEDPGGPFFLDAEGRTPDPIEDDLSLWLRTEEGTVLLAGCCHAGLVNTLDHVRRLTDGAKIRAVLGGFHLIGASGRRIHRTADVLAERAPGIVVPCHCTGAPAVLALHDRLGDIVFPGAAGMRFDF